MGLHSPLYKVVCVMKIKLLRYYLAEFGFIYQFSTALCTYSMKEVF